MDDWVTETLAQDYLVVELLLRLKHAQAETQMVNKNPVTTFSWGCRQRRSRSMRGESGSHKKGDDSGTNARGSPTTPLSWSGGCTTGSASPSRTADGFEETSLQVSGSRSKVPAAKETTGVTSKRSKKRKTYAELKEEESLLLEESTYLKKELATLSTTFKEHRAKNKNLRKMKVDLNFEQTGNICSTSDDGHEEICGQPHERVSVDDHWQSNSIETDKKSGEESLFLLPDLNMLPCEGDDAVESLCGMS